jgi:hypothetical protein
MTKSFIGRCNVSGAHRPRFDCPPNLTGGCKASVLRGDDAAIFDKKRCCCVTSETSDTDIFPVNDFDHTSPGVLAMSCSASYSTKKISFFYDQRETVGSLFCFLKGPLKSCRRRCAIHVSVFVVFFLPLYFLPKTFVCYFFNVRKKKLGKTLKQKPTQNREIVFLVQKPRH